MNPGRRSLLVLVCAIPAGCALAFDFEGFARDPAEAGATTEGGIPRDKIVAGTETCTNGVDDDGDGLADCADPKCMAIGYACRAVPDGWQGPYAIAAGERPVACGAPFDTALVEAKSDLRAPRDTSCRCACGPVINAGCSGLLHIESSCGTGSSYSLTMECREIPSAPGNLPWKSNLAGQGGGCQPIPEPPTPPSWGMTFRGCGTSSELPTGGCVGEHRCAPPTPDGFGAGHCVVHAEDVVCPEGYPNKQLAYLGLADGRACQCTCAPPECPTDLTVYASAGCAAGGVNVPDKCSGVASGIRSARVGNGGGLSCTPSEGRPYGTAAPASPITICCGG